MTPPTSVKYTLGCQYAFIDDLIAEDREVFNSIGYESLIKAKEYIQKATWELQKVEKAWKQMCQESRK